MKTSSNRPLITPLEIAGKTGTSAASCMAKMPAPGPVPVRKAPAAAKPLSAPRPARPNV